MPRIGFGSADCIQRDRYILYIVSQSADSKPFRGTDGCVYLENGSDQLIMHRGWIDRVYSREGRFWN